jgi:hypothetical protein
MELERDAVLSVLVPSNTRVARHCAARLGLAAAPGGEPSAAADAAAAAAGAAAAAAGAAAPTTAAAGAGTDSAARARLDREFVFPGETATVLVLVEASEATRGRLRAQGEVSEWLEQCRQLEVLVSAAADCARCSSVQLCPKQPEWRPDGDPAGSTAGAEPTDGSAAAVDALLGRCCAVYFFELEVPFGDARRAPVSPGWSGGAAGGVSLSAGSPLSPEAAGGDSLSSSFASGAMRSHVSELFHPGFAVELQLYVRLKQALSESSQAARTAKGLVLEHELAASSDPMSFARCIPLAHAVLLHDEPSLSVRSQTVQLHRTLRRERCLSVRSRYSQVDGRCLIEVRCENASTSGVQLRLKDVTLHTFTSRPVSISVARVGRWLLPLTLLPGERQSLCFMLSDFAAKTTLPEGPTSPAPADDATGSSTGSGGRQGAPGGGASVGSRYTSMATVTWGSDVTLSDVRGQHRVEWEFNSGAFDPLMLRLVPAPAAPRFGTAVHRADGAPGVGSLLRPGDKVKVTLEVAARARAATGRLVVLCPTASDGDLAPLIPLDAVLPLPESEGTVTRVLLEFLACRPGRADLSRLVFVHDSATDRTLEVKEPYHVTVFS